MPAADPSRLPPIRRVLMTADAVGGVWRYALDLASAMRTRGIEVTMAVMGPEPTAARRADADRVATVESRPYRLEWMDDPWDDVVVAGEWLLDLESRARPDVVHLNGYSHASLPWHAPAIVVAHSCVCSWWRGVHGTDAPAQFDRYRLEVSRGLASARMVVAPSTGMRDAIRREYETAAGIRVIPNGLSITQPEGGRGGKQPIIFAAGRLWDEAKNIGALCDVAAALPWPVYVAGSDTGLDGRCAATGYARYLGLLEPDDMRIWFARASIYALPARYEPFGLSVLEAAAAGCALVLGDIPSLRENWTGAAVFVAPDNRRALAGALRRLMEEPQQCSRLGTLARDRARRFTVDRMADAYLAAYRDLLGSDLNFRNEPRIPSENRDLTPGLRISLSPGSLLSENRDLTPL